MEKSRYFDTSDFIAYVEMFNYPGFPHYYAYLRFKDMSERLGYVMTAEDAKAHNKINRQRGAKDFSYKRGSWCEQFFSTHEVREVAVKVFSEGQYKNEYSDETHSLEGAKFLVDGQRAVAQPQKIIACAPGLEEPMKELNDLFQQGEEVDRWNWDVDNEKLDMLSTLWFALLKRTEGQR